MIGLTCRAYGASSACNEGSVAVAEIDKLVTDALVTIEKCKREVDVAEGRLQMAEHAYKFLRERQRKESPTLADLVEADARRPVRGY